MQDSFNDPVNPFSRHAVADSREVNPYSPTVNLSPEAAVAGDVEAIRRFHLNHEASVKSIGVLYMIGAVFMIPFGVLAILGGLAGEAGPSEAIIVALVGVVYLSLGILQGFTAVGLRRLRPWAKTVATVLSAIGLIGFPIVTLVSAYFLYLLVSEKGKVVFSPEYQNVIAQTPHIKYKTSIVVWIFLVLLVVLIGIGLAAAIVGG